MSYIRKTILIFTLSFSMTVSAQDQLPPMTVSASRTPIAISQSGSSVMLINQQHIQHQQVPFVADLLRDVPGTAISQNGGTGALSQLRIRGAEANHTLVLIDGIEANDVVFNNGVVSCGKSPW